MVGLEGNSSVPEHVRRNGTEERPEWDASPEKPSKPLRIGTRSYVLLSWPVCGVSCLFLRIRSAPFSILVLSRIFLRAAVRALAMRLRVKHGLSQLLY
jgi:hypothetical protein